MGSLGRGNSIASSKEYKSFRNAVALRRSSSTSSTVRTEHGASDYGPRDIRTPIIFLPPASGTADVFFSQILALAARDTASSAPTTRPT